MCKALDWTLFHFIVCSSHLSDEVCLLRWYIGNMATSYWWGTNEEARHFNWFECAGGSAHWSTCCINYSFCCCMIRTYAFHAYNVCSVYEHILSVTHIVLDYPESSWLLSSDDSIIRFRYLQYVFSLSPFSLFLSVQAVGDVVKSYISICGTAVVDK